MPAHKHKKNKKKHKHQTKHNAAIFPKVVMWREKLPNSDSDTSENEDKLTCLVRRSYTNHVQEALIQNFKMCVNSSSLTSSSIEEMVEKWSSALENKALKACMIKEQYRKNMVSLIKHIQAATDDRRLCFEEQSLRNLISRLPSSKETQTENISLHPKMFTAESQTDSTISSSLKQNISNTLMSDPNDSVTDLLSVTCVSSSQPLDNSNQDVCGIITSTSDLSPPTLSALNIDIPLKAHTKNPLGDSHSCVNPTTFGGKCSLTNIFSGCLESKKQSDTCDKTFNKLSDYSGELQEHSFVDSRHSFEPNMCEINTQSSLDFDLTTVESLSGIDLENNLNQLTSSKYKKSNWFAEETAQLCNLTRILLQMSVSRRERVMKKIKELFGDTEIPLAELTSQNIAICRKRIASAVVMELTPIYKSKKIASRKLFKFLAKKITKSIMDQSYAPDTRIVRWKVRDFFSDGKIITNESDC